MDIIDRIYIDGKFVTPHGQEMFDLFNPATSQVIGQVQLADEVDADAAVAAARRAFPAFSRTTKAERRDLLIAMGEALAERRDALIEAMVMEFGAPVMLAGWMADHAVSVFHDTSAVLDDYAFVRPTGIADVVMTPLGVAALITPWNGNAGSICGKLAAALAAGCTAVVKPSELSAMQTLVVAEALHAAGASAGVFNIVTGRGDVVGAALVAHPDVAKISFTGSTQVGKSIARGAADRMKRVTLELGGKSPVVVLDDADFAAAIPLAVNAGFMNSGQACVAGTRLLVPANRVGEAEQIAAATAEAMTVGDPQKPDTVIGPMVSARQWERVQRYIGLGIAEGARPVAGGEGRPAGLDGWFVRPTIFSDAHNGMTIARDEIFGPVITIIPYADEEDAIAIANDTDYGLQAYVLSGDPGRARGVADRLEAGRVLINTLAHEPTAPFGGFKQSGIGREYGMFGLDAFLEPKAVLGVHPAP
jgi:aldehyde dehydrogenase (NAD+)